jgi:tRNA(Ile)-lysidine synthase
VLAHLAEVPVSRERVAQLLSFDHRGTRELDVGGGVRAVVEYGHVRFASEPAAPAPGPVTLPVPGRARFGVWDVEAAPGDTGEAVLSAAQLGDAVTIRAWREGDRMRPAGMSGTKSLQDLFTDRKVPRALRHSLPLAEADGAIVWVAGVAAAERGAGDPVSLTARRASGGGA